MAQKPDARRTIVINEAIPTVFLIMLIIHFSFNYRFVLTPLELIHDRGDAAKEPGHSHHT